MVNREQGRGREREKGGKRNRIKMHYALEAGRWDCCACVCVSMVHTSIGCVLGRSGLTVSNKSIEQRLSLSRS